MDQFVGEIRYWCGRVPPKGWKFCDGSLLKIKDNQVLYSLLYKRFGGDDTHFALPDLRGRLPVGTGTSSQTRHTYVLGEKAGQEHKTVTKENMPKHSHDCPLEVTEISFLASTQPPDSSVPIKEGNLSRARDYTEPMADDPKQYIGPDAANLVSLDKVKLLSAGGPETGDAGSGGTGHEYNNHMPFLAVNMIIAVNGIYPSRN